MKRDDDFLRQFLLDAEAQPDWGIVVPRLMNPSQEQNKADYHAELLCDAGLLAEVGDSVFRLTFQGHDYLDAVRSDTIWSKTKAGAAEVGGMTLGMMKDLAIAYIKQEATERLGIAL